MPVDEPIDQPGFFWLPENDAEQFPGTLTVDETGGITLRLFAKTDKTRFDGTQASLNPLLAKFMGSSVYGRVHGLIRGRAVTLDRCIPTTIPWLADGIAEGSYNVRRAYIGAWYDADETPTFSRLNFKIDTLQEWLMLSGLRTDFDFETLPHEGFTVSYDPPAPITVQLSSGTTFSFKFLYSLPSISIAPAEATITQSAYLSLQAPSVASFGELASIVTTFKRFLSFAADQACDVTSIVGFSPELVDDGRELPVNIYTGKSDLTQPTREPSWTRMLFTFRDVEPRFPNALDDWLRIINELEPAINLYDALMLNAYRYADGRFLATAQAIEALHRRLYPQNQQMGDDEFMALRDALVEASPPNRRTWVKERLRHANEPTLRRRVHDLVDDFKPYFGTPQESSAFVHNVVDFRNRLTHLPTDSDDKSIDGKSLILTQKKLEILFQLHVLRQLGFDDDAINEIARKRLLPKLEIQFL